MWVPKKLFIGYDHRFGNNREGNIESLKAVEDKYEYQVYEIPKQEIDDIGVSSTKIRKALQNGEIKRANSLLGRDYSITGIVVDGNRLGRKLGFPTANINISESYKLLPGDGAYAIYAYLNDRKFSGMLNIGVKPTVDGKSRSIEAHLFNFDEEIYGTKLKIEFVEALRKEAKFESIEQLRNQLIADKKKAKEVL